MRLVIGITEILPSWKIVLDQIGVSYENINFNNKIKIEDYSTIIITQKYSLEIFTTRAPHLIDLLILWILLILDIILYVT